LTHRYFVVLKFVSKLQNCYVVLRCFEKSLQIYKEFLIDMLNLFDGCYFQVIVGEARLRLRVLFMYIIIILEVLFSEIRHYFLPLQLNS